MEVGLAFVERLQEHLVRLVPRRSLSAFLDVEALVCLAERADAFARVLGEEHRAERARHREPFAVLAECFQRVVQQAARDRGVRRREQAELVAAEPIAAAVAGS